MTAGVQGTGLYSRLRDLHFQQRQLKNELANKPMGPRTRRRKEGELLALQLQLRRLNIEVLQKRHRKELLRYELALQAAHFRVMNHPSSDVYGLARAYRRDIYN